MSLQSFLNLSTSFHMHSLLADISIIINNSFIADVVDYFKQLNELGTVVSLLNIYIFMYLCMGVIISLRYFINYWLDPLIEHLIEESEKNWSWEEPTHYRNGLDYLPNLLMSLDRITKEAEDGLAKLRKREAEQKEEMERQAETIRLNEIEQEKYLEYRRKHPFTEEEKKRELKFLLDEMHKEYGHLFDDENPQ